MFLQDELLELQYRMDAAVKQAAAPGTPASKPENYFASGKVPNLWHLTAARGMNLPPMAAPGQASAPNAATAPAPGAQGSSAPPASPGWNMQYGLGGPVAAAQTGKSAFIQDSLDELRQRMGEATFSKQAIPFGAVAGLLKPVVRPVINTATRGAAAVGRTASRVMPGTAGATERAGVLPTGVRPAVTPMPVPPRGATSAAAPVVPPPRPAAPAPASVLPTNAYGNPTTGAAATSAARAPTAVPHSGGYGNPLGAGAPLTPPAAVAPPGVLAQVGSGIERARTPFQSLMGVASTSVPRRMWNAVPKTLDVAANTVLQTGGMANMFQAGGNAARNLSSLVTTGRLGQNAVRAPLWRALGYGGAGTTLAHIGDSVRGNSSDPHRNIGSDLLSSLDMPVGLLRSMGVPFNAPRNPDLTSTSSILARNLRNAGTIGDAVGNVATSEMRSDQLSRVPGAVGRGLLRIPASWGDEQGGVFGLPSHNDLNRLQRNSLDESNDQAARVFADQNSSAYDRRIAQQTLQSHDRTRGIPMNVALGNGTQAPATGSQTVAQAPAPGGSTAPPGWPTGAPLEASVAPIATQQHQGPLEPQMQGDLQDLGQRLISGTMAAGATRLNLAPNEFMQHLAQTTPDPNNPVQAIGMQNLAAEIHKQTQQVPQQSQVQQYWDSLPVWGRGAIVGGLGLGLIGLLLQLFGGDGAAGQMAPWLMMAGLGAAGYGAYNATGGDLSKLKPGSGFYTDVANTARGQRRMQGDWQLPAPVQNVSGNSQNVGGGQGGVRGGGQQQNSTGGNGQNNQPSGAQQTQGQPRITAQQQATANAAIGAFDPRNPATVQGVSQVLRDLRSHIPQAEMATLTQGMAVVARGGGDQPSPNIFDSDRRPVNQRIAARFQAHGITVSTDTINRMGPHWPTILSQAGI